MIYIGHPMDDHRMYFRSATDNLETWHGTVIKMSKTHPKYIIWAQTKTMGGYPQAIVCH
jgi:hypothetical protein